MRRLDNATHLTMLDPVTANQLHRLYAYPDDQLPWLRVNFVSTLDGAVSVDGRSGPMGGPADRTVFNTLRDLADVILVGAGTVRAEGYGGAQVSDAQQAARIARGQSPVPPIAIVSASGHLDPGLRVFTEAQTPTIVLTTTAADVDSLTAAGAEVRLCDQADGPGVDLPAALSWLTARGLGRVLCEGGPRLFGDLLGADAVDELCLTFSPLLTAGAAPRIATSDASVLHRMRRAHLLLDEDGTLLSRWVRDRTAG